MPGLQGLNRLGASALGLILGLMLCAGALRVLRNVLYGVGVYDAPTMYNEVVSTTLMPL